VKKPSAPSRGFFQRKSHLAIHPRSSERGILAFLSEASHAGTAPGEVFSSVLFSLT
jgi:hypothetical protein